MTVEKSLVPKGISPRAGKFIPATELTGKERGGMKVRLQRTARFRRLADQDVKKVHYEDVVKSDSPDFNHKAARAAFDLVMKMDEDEAREFTTMVVSNILEETIEKNRRELQRTLDRVVSKRLRAVQRATLTAAVSKRDDETLGFAQALGMISKSDVWDEHKVNRDPSSGRFRTKISHAQTKPIHARTASSMGIQGLDNKKYKTLTPKQQAEYQDEYRQLANFLSSVQSSTRNPGDVDILMHFKDKKGGRVWTERQSGTKINRDLLYDSDHRLMGVEAVPNSLSAGGAYFGLTTALGTSPSSRTAAITRGVNTVNSDFSSFADSWNEEASSHNGNEKMYNRLASGSQFVGQIAPAGSKTQLAARFGQFVGDHGAEAESVVGPHARKTAYRYRGTSKTPDNDVVGEYNRAIQSAKMGNIPANATAPVQLAAHRISAERRNPNWEERGAGRAVLANWLMKESPAKPKPGLYNLQLASGNTPPSEGFIIDASGQVTDQAVGYGDDHYLPFNLKHLKSLKGGEYIRTRSVGGLTAEDVYTGLMSGARQVTVVSRSGTFSMEFQPDFKGGRRYNDKALRMTKRYTQLLDAVQSQQVDRMQVSPEIRNAIKDEVVEEMGGLGMSTRDMSAEITRRVNEFKENPELSENDERLARLIATQRAGGRQGKDADDFMAQAMSDIAQQKEYKFRLNGAGYAAALEALHEQFPYYIKVNANPRVDPDRFETEMDQGYVEPGRNRPTAAKAGLFGTQINPGQKFSASHADFQGGSKTRRPGAVETRGELKPAEAAPKPNFKSAVAEQKKKVEFLTAAQALQARGLEMLDDPSKAAFADVLAMTPDDFRDPAKQAKFDAWASQFASMSAAGPAGAAYKAAAGHVGQVELHEDRYGLWGAKPYDIGPVADKDGMKKKIDAKSKSGIIHNKPLSHMTDAELKDEHSALSQIDNYLSVSGAEGMSAADKVELLSGLGVAKGAPGLNNLLEKSNVKDRLRQVHEMRALNQDVPDDKRDPNSGDIIITHAPPAAEEMGGARVAVEHMARILTEAGDKLADNGLDDEADEFHLAAQNLHDSLQGDVHQREAQLLREQNEEILRRAYRLKGSGSGNILS